MSAILSNVAIASLIVSVVFPLFFLLIYRRKNRDSEKPEYSDWIECEKCESNETRKAYKKAYKKNLLDKASKYAGINLANQALSSTKENFVLKEYDRYSDLFKENETLGERRVNIFLTLITSIVSAIGITTIIADSGSYSGVQKSDFILFGSFILLGLFFYGIFTLRRIVARNVSTDDYKIQLDIIRVTFKLDIYSEVTKTRRKQLKHSIGFQKGGFAETVKLLNSMIMGFAYVGLWIYPSLSAYNSIQQQLPLVSLAFSIGFAGAWITQSIFVNYFYIKDEEWKVRVVNKNIWKRCSKGEDRV